MILMEFLFLASAIQCNRPNAENDPALWSLYKCSVTMEKQQMLQLDWNCHPFCNANIWMGQNSLFTCSLLSWSQLATSTSLWVCKFRIYWISGQI